MWSEKFRELNRAPALHSWKFFLPPKELSPWAIAPKAGQARLQLSTAIVRSPALPASPEPILCGMCEDDAIGAGGGPPLGMPGGGSPGPPLSHTRHRRPPGLPRPARINTNSRMTPRKHASDCLAFGTADFTSGLPQH